MTSLMHLLSLNSMHALGWTLLHFLWQGMALAAVTAVSLVLCRRASTRYVIAVIALVLMLAAPIVTFAYLCRSTATFTTLSTVRDSLSGIKSSPLAHTVATLSPVASSPDRLSWLVELWLFGVACLSIR